MGVGVKHDHPGRPRYEMVFPATATFTFTELMAANGVDTHKYLKNGHANSNYGKGENCTMLTCRKNLKFDLARGEVCLMKGYTAKPDSDDGLGRAAVGDEVLILRASCAAARRGSCRRRLTGG